MNTLLFRQPRIFALVIGMIVVIGLSSYSSIGRQEDPTITNLFATILTPLPGADPSRVETLVTKKLEDRLKEISEIVEIRSTSRTGISFVQVELSSFINKQQIDQSWSEIRDAIDDARSEMPQDVGRSTFDNSRTGAYTSISTLNAGDGSNVSAAQLLRYAKLLQDRLRQLGGTDIVSLFGDPEEVIYVEVDDVDLVAIGMTMQQVAAAIEAADSKVMAGRSQQSKTDFIIEVAGEIKALKRLADIPLRGERDGQQILLGDIATFKQGVDQPRQRVAFTGDDEVIMIAARMKPDLQVDKWSRQVGQVFAEFQQTLPVDVQFTEVFSQAEYTEQRLTDVFINMAIGVSLVVGVLFFTLGWRSAIVVAIVLPLTSLGSISVLQFLGIPIHQMSVTGLIVALGLLVDAAIVMTDEIHKRLRAGKDRLMAVGDAVSRLKTPLLASTITTALAFTPMALLPGPAGDFVGSIALSVIVMLIVSLILALTVTPALAGWMLTDQEPNTVLSTLFKRISDWFHTTLEWSVVNPKASVFVACLVPLMGFLAFPTLTAQFFPGVDRDQFYIQLELTNGSSFEHTLATAKRADDLLTSVAGIKEVQWVVGQSAPPFYYNMQQNRDGDPRFAEALVTTDSSQVTEQLVPELQTMFDQQIPEAQVLVRGLVQGPPVAAPVEFKIFGPDLAVLRQIGNQVRQRMSLVDDIIHSRASLNGGAPKMVFDLNEAKVRQAGYNLRDIAASLNANLSGIQGGSLLDQTEELPVRVRMTDARRVNSDYFSALKLPIINSENNDTARGNYIPLTSFGDYALQPGKSTIRRENGERINTVQGYIRHGLLPEEVLKQVKTEMTRNPIDLPIGYRIATGGDSDARSETTGNLMSSMGLIIALSIATIVLTFQSYRLSIIAGIVTFLSMGLSLFALAVFQFPFGIQALIGVIGSIGVSINAAIIILTSLQANSDAMAGSRSAIVAQVMGASRHIVSTTVTTCGGFLPLLVEGGGFWPPFAMAIAGGVLLSTIVSFYFTPPMFLLIYAKKESCEPLNTSDPQLVSV